MTKLRMEISMSLDGYIAGPNATIEEPLGENGERLHDWLTRHSAARSTHDERVAALVVRGVAPERAGTLADSLATLHGRILAAGRPIENPSPMGGVT